MVEEKYPAAGIAYPGTFQEFDKWFPSNDACLDYIAKLRWPTNFCCPNCLEATEQPSLMKRGLFLCRKCKRQTYVTAGTLFHRTHKPLRVWFLAIWFVTSQKHGTSALVLKSVLGLGSYNTAWNWLHKLRRAMVQSIVAIAAEIRGRGPGRIRISIIPDVSSSSLHEFILNNVKHGSKIHTDGWSGYSGLESIGFKHIATNIADSGDPAHVVIPRVHLVASLLDRWWLGIHRSNSSRAT